MGALIICDKRAILEAGAKRRLWWSAEAVARRTGISMLPIDAALAGVAMGRWIAIQPGDVGSRESAVRSLITTGFVLDLTGVTTLRDAVAQLPRNHPVQKG